LLEALHIKASYKSYNLIHGMTNRVVHFEIQADNPKRAIKFYEYVFGWEFPLWMKKPLYYGVMTASVESKTQGINGGLLKRPAKTSPARYGTNAFVCTIQVADFDKTAKKILKMGGRVALPKHAIAGIAWQGYFLDTEGNTFGIHQPDTDAK